MTFKQFMYGAFVLPSKALSGISDLLLGSYQRDKNGEIKIDYRTKQPLTNRGLLGGLLDGIKLIGRIISNFLTNHHQAIASAFWFSALFAGAAALTVFLWPAALTAVTTFTIAGYSIAGVVGANVIAQIGAVAALTAIATSAVVYVVAGFINTINFFRECVANKRKSVQGNNDQHFDELKLEDSTTKMSTAFGGLRQESDSDDENGVDEEPQHTGNVLRNAANSNNIVQEESPEKTTPAL